MTHHAIRVALEIVANAASILTAIILAGFYIDNRCTWAQKRKRLEDYLRDQKSAGKDKGERTILHLIRHVALTESDILQCAFESRVIGRRVSRNEKGRAETLYLVYEEKISN